MIVVWLIGGVLAMTWAWWFLGGGEKSIETIPPPDLEDPAVEVEEFIQRNDLPEPNAGAEDPLSVIPRPAHVEDHAEVPPPRAVPAVIEQPVARADDAPLFDELPPLAPLPPLEPLPPIDGSTRQW